MSSPQDNNLHPQPVRTSYTEQRSQRLSELEQLRKHQSVRTLRETHNDGTRGSSRSSMTLSMEEWQKQQRTLTAEDKKKKRDSANLLHSYNYSDLLSPVADESSLLSEINALSSVERYRLQQKVMVEDRKKKMDDAKKNLHSFRMDPDVIMKQQQRHSDTMEQNKKIDDEMQRLNRLSELEELRKHQSVRTLRETHNNNDGASSSTGSAAAALSMEEWQRQQRTLTAEDKKKKRDSFNLLNRHNYSDLIMFSTKNVMKDLQQDQQQQNQHQPDVIAPDPKLRTSSSSPIAMKDLMTRFSETLQDQNEQHSDVMMARPESGSRLFSARELFDRTNAIVEEDSNDDRQQQQHSMDGLPSIDDDNIIDRSPAVVDDLEDNVIKSKTLTDDDIIANGDQEVTIGKDDGHDDPIKEEQIDENNDDPDEQNQSIPSSEDDNDDTSEAAAHDNTNVETSDDDVDTMLNAVAVAKAEEETSIHDDNINQAMTTEISNDDNDDNEENSCGENILATKDDTDIAAVESLIQSLSINDNNDNESILKNNDEPSPMTESVANDNKSDQESLPQSRNTDNSCEMISSNSDTIETTEPCIYDDIGNDNDCTENHNEVTKTETTTFKNEQHKIVVPATTTTAMVTEATKDDDDTTATTATTVETEFADDLGRRQPHINENETLSSSMRYGIVNKQQYQSNNPTKNNKNNNNNNKHLPSSHNISNISRKNVTENKSNEKTTTTTSHNKKKTIKYERRIMLAAVVLETTKKYYALTMPLMKTETNEQHNNLSLKTKHDDVDDRLFWAFWDYIYFSL